MDKRPLTVSESLKIVAAGIVLWIPMMTFIAFFSDTVSPKTLGVIGAVNLPLGFGLLLYFYRTRIRPSHKE